MKLSIVGRSSSHYTRTVRIFAHELAVPYAFRVVADLTSRDAQQYADNPALKIPVLETPGGPWFGALNICRELARHAADPLEVLWPEGLQERDAANAQELVLSGMSTEVALIMQAGAGAIATDSKAYDSLTNSLRWLDSHLPDVLARTNKPGRLSFLEITAYCFISHLPFRNVADVSTYRALLDFCEVFEQRPSARATTYRFDLAS